MTYNSLVSENKILKDIFNLYEMYNKGHLGGKIMPEDSNPGLPRDSKGNYHFFTLPMALNYQRDVFALWKAAHNSYEDDNITSVFDPERAASMGEDKLRMYLSTYNLAIQPVKQSQIWRRNCESICSLLKGDIRNLFASSGWYIPEIMRFIQVTHKRDFPFLSGIKLFSYWLHVLERYTDACFAGREHLTIAPDTHVIKATIRLGIISEELAGSHKIQRLVTDAWACLLKGTGIAPIDMHTPLWLWSKNGFKEISDLVVQNRINKKIFI